MSKLSARFANALKAGHATQLTTPKETPTKKYVLAMIFDLDLHEAQSTIGRIRKSVENTTTLVFITDRQEIALFQLENCITEYLPHPDLLKSRFPRKSSQAYLVSRLQVLMRKWQPIQTLEIGPRATDLFADLVAQNLGAT